MAIDGIQAFAKCTVCGTIMWTEVRPDPDADQACVCKCGNTGIVNQHVVGDADQSFAPTSIDDLLAAEAQS